MTRLAAQYRALTPQELSKYVAMGNAVTKAYKQPTSKGASKGLQKQVPAQATIKQR